MAGIRVTNLRKTFGSFEALRSVSLEVRDQEFTVLLGPSGCGKTTLLRIIAGLETETAGEVRIGGQRVNGLPPRARNIAMVFQNYAIYPHMTVGQNIGFGLYTSKLSKAEKQQRIAETAKILGLDPQYPLRYLAYFLIVVAVGGLGKVSGVFFAALLIGVLDFVLKIHFPKGGTMFIYALTLAFLLARPQGIFGRRGA